MWVPWLDEMVVPCTIVGTIVLFFWLKYEEKLLEDSSSDFYSLQSFLKKGLSLLKKPTPIISPDLTLFATGFLWVMYTYWNNNRKKLFWDEKYKCPKSRGVLKQSEKSKSLKLSSPCRVIWENIIIFMTFHLPTNEFPQIYPYRRTMV